MIKNKSRPLVLIFSALLWASMTHAQESINAAGGDASIAGGGSMAYSIGIVVYTTEISRRGSVAQGVQHAYPNQKRDDSSQQAKKFEPAEGVSADMSESALAKSLTAFPNPTSQMFTLQMSEFDQEELLTYQLCNTEGKIIEQGQIRDENTNFNLSQHASGSYTLYVLNQENKTIKTFKVIKN